jgi:hypothetical protein
MKLTLPIPIPSIPSPDASPELWRQIAPILSAIAERERQDEDLYPYEKIAYSALSFATWNASKKQWSALWQYLLDRQIVQISKIAAPPPPKPKSDRPTKPPKSRIAKPIREKKPRPKRVKNRKKITNRKSPTYLYVFACLKPCLSGLRSLITLWQWLAYAAPLCPRSKPPLRLRGKGEKIKPILCAKTKDGDWSRLRVWMRSSKRWYKIGDNVRDLLIEWSNPYRTKARKRKEKVESTPKRVIRVISMDEINQVLTDKWQDISTITNKLNTILSKPIELSELSKLLSKRSASGLLIKLHYSQKALTYYSRIEATEFENQWMALDMAYQLAKSRGYQRAKNTFRKHHRCNYSAYGLEFRREVPKTENKLLRWRDIQA